MEDLQISVFEEQLIDFINGVPLPWTVKRLVLKEVYEGVEKTAYQSIAQQKASIRKEGSDGKGIRKDNVEE